MRHFKVLYFVLLFAGFMFLPNLGYSWGFYAHGCIHRYAVFLLPPPLLLFYKSHMDYITVHATDADRRRYLIKEEGPRHYIDLDHYGQFPFFSLPRSYREAKECYGEDSLQAHGIVPWQIRWSLSHLTEAFRKKDVKMILKYSADLGHYMSDAHVPLHTSSNHNGQYTNQHGIHGFWESRVPELLAESTFDFFIGPAVYLNDPESFIWKRVLESAYAVDSVLTMERKLSASIRPDGKYAFEERNGKLIRQYSASFTTRYNTLLSGMVERRMRQSIHAVASAWMTAWMDAGQPELSGLMEVHWSEQEQKEMELLYENWMEAHPMIGRSE
jgi:hypothetical protein